ncbi:5869_t:CDS:2, partial [Racocetra fulgida]
TAKDESISDNRISLPEPKTPAEFALHILRKQFYKIADRKLSAIMSHNLEHEPDFVHNIGPGVDPVFDKILNSLGYIARHKPKPVIDLVLIWRKEKQELKQDGPEPSHKLVKQVRPETLRDDVGKQLEDLAFKHVIDSRSSRHAIAVYDLFAELIGELSRIRFMSVSDRFISELERYTPNALKEQESKIELLIRGMHFLQLKIYPLEALEETADFLQSLANFLRHAHGVRIKHAYARLFVRLFMPIAGLSEIIRHLFPQNRRSVYVNLDLFVQFIHFVGIRHHDYCMKNLIFMLMNSENIANSNTSALELIAPERMRIGIRSFMMILYSMQTSELRPPFPSNPDLFDQRQGLGIKISSDILSDDIFNQAGLKENVDRFCDISYRVAVILDQHFGHLTVLDERNLTK